MLRGRSGVAGATLRTLLESGTVTGFTDAQLVERFALRRDESSFAALVARHGPMVLGICRRCLGDEHRAEDAFQAVFLVLARRADAIRCPDRLGPWLYGVALKVARKVRAQDDRCHARERLEPDLVDRARPEPESLQPQDATAVHEEIGRLPEPYRRAVILCHFEGLTHAEAAQRLGCPVGTVSAQVKRARDLLRPRLERRGLIPGAALLAVALDPKVTTAAVPPALERATVLAAQSFATGGTIAAGTICATAVELANGVTRTMTFSKAMMIGAVSLGLSMAALGAAAFGFGARRADEPSTARNPDQPPNVLPHLPGALTSPPDWLDPKTVPFDVVAFFAAPPPDQNAAPLYLDALFEFDKEVAICFPEGPERERRTQAVEGRARRFNPLYSAVRKAPKLLSGEEAGAVLDEYDEGYRKLDLAQQRPKCVFETGLGITARVPHLSAARNLGSITELKLRRELGRGDFDRALHDLERMYRLARDLRPRGGFQALATSVSLERGRDVDNPWLPLLVASLQTTEQCDRLLSVLKEQEKRSVDPYTESVKTEYMQDRATLNDLIYHQQRLRQEWNSFGNPAGPSIVAEITEPTFTLLASNKPTPPPTLRQRIQNQIARYQGLVEQLSSLRNVPDLDARIAQTTPEALAHQVDKLNELCRTRLEVTQAPILERVDATRTLPASFNQSDLLSRVTNKLVGDSYSRAILAQVAGKDVAYLHLAQTLATVRRWQLSHEGQAPATLAEAVHEAGLPVVPIDPYDNQPIRMAIIDGQVVVYAIGPDGKDDGGREETRSATAPGDVLLRLPPTSP